VQRANPRVIELPERGRIIIAGWWVATAGAWPDRMLVERRPALRRMMLRRAAESGSTGPSDAARRVCRTHPPIPPCVTAAHPTGLPAVLAIRKTPSRTAKMAFSIPTGTKDIHHPRAARNLAISVWPLSFANPIASMFFMFGPVYRTVASIPCASSNLTLQDAHRKWQKRVLLGFACQHRPGLEQVLTTSRCPYVAASLIGVPP
jgi:hypothetical protein